MRTFGSDAVRRGKSSEKELVQTIQIVPFKPRLWLKRLSWLAFFCWIVLAYWMRLQQDDACAQNANFQIVLTGILPSIINESSGLIRFTDSTFLTHNDDNDSNLYEISTTGRLINTFPITGVQTTDWESITSDSAHIYLGDFGNNLNKRKSLRIYIISKATMNVIDTIQYRYADQLHFPPLLPSEMNFDVEAMVAYNDSLYLFSKNRTATSYSTVYVVPAKAGFFVANKVATVYLNGQVTDAALSADTQRLALLTYGKLYFVNWPLLAGKANTEACINLYQGRQCEGIVYTQRDTLYFTNEQRGIYRINPKKSQH